MVSVVQSSLACGSKNRRAPSPRPALFESLERRRLFNTAQFTGTEGADLISLTVGGGMISVSINGATEQRLDALFDSIHINGLGGNDRIDIHSTGNNPVTVNAGAGDDILQICPASQDLGNLQRDVTINGDGGFDTLRIFDINQAASVSYTLTGAQLARGGVGNVTANTIESWTLRGGLSGSALTVSGPPVPQTLSFVGGSGVNNNLIIDGNGSGSATLTPSGTTSGSGAVDFAGRTINYSGCEHALLRELSSASFVTPNAADNIGIGINSSATSITGSSGGVAFNLVRCRDIGALTIDVGTNDTAGATDTIICGQGMAGTSLLRFNTGIGTNILRFNSGNDWVIDTSIGTTGGTALSVILSNADTAVRFSGAQNLLRLEFRNGGLARFNGAGTVLTAQLLEVPTGSGTIELAAAQTAICPAGGAFHNNGSLTKRGAGTLTIFGTQGHGTGSALIVQNGTVNLNTDAGELVPGLLTINVGPGGVVNLNASQHVGSVFADRGSIRMGSNGNRVLVTGAVGVGSEGGEIDLRDNHMIVDYSGDTPLDQVFQLLKNGFANAGWNGIGINSSTAAARGNTALGYAEATDLFSTFPATFAGEPVDSTSILIKHTFYGDSDLNGSVNLSDFNRLAANFGQSGRRWVQGDSTYDLAINLADFNRLAGAFGQSASSTDGRGSTWEQIHADQERMSDRVAEL